MPDIQGDQIVFGFNSADAPTGITGFFTYSLEMKDEPEVLALATDGYGQAIAAAASKANLRMKTATFVGYIDKDSFDPVAAATGTLTYKTQKFYVKSVSEPINKGQFVEVSIEAEYLPLAQ